MGDHCVPTKPETSSPQHRLAFGVEEIYVSCRRMSQTQSIRVLTKFAYLDGLRGIACLIVVIDHWFSMGFQQGKTRIPYPNHSVFWEPWLYHSPLRLLVAGEFAVAMFFILSGYVLLASFYPTPSSRRVLLGSVLRRWPRLWLPTSLSALIYYAWLNFGPFEGGLICHATGDVDQYSLNNATYITPSYMMVNTAIGQWFWQPAVYSIQWTLQIELIFSFFSYFMALVISFIPYMWARTALYIIVIFLLPILHLAGVDIPRAVQYLVPFSIGGLFSMWDLFGRKEITENKLASIQIMEEPIQQVRPLDVMRNLEADKPILFHAVHIFLWLLGIYFGSYPVFVVLGTIEGTLWQPLGWMFGWFWISLGSALIMLSVLTSKVLQAFLSSRVVHFLGKISFGVYLIHYQVLIFADVLIMKPFLENKWLTINAIVPIAFIVFVLPFVIGFSYLFYVYVDTASVSLGRIICKILQGPQWDNQDDIESRWSILVDNLISRKFLTWVLVYIMLILICYMPTSTQTCQHLNSTVH
jgi:peptidoglycan/LPS O-acetylase OafA/YrhL